MANKPFRPSLPSIKSSYYGDAGHINYKEVIEDYLAPNSRQLPMYKDKPGYGANGRRKGENRGAKAGTLALFAIIILWLTGLLPLPGFPEISAGQNSDAYKWRSRKEAVRQAFITSWDYYAEHAWGMDEFHPVSLSSRNMGCARNDGSTCPPTGWIIVDALDTAMMMNLTSRVARAREWISTSLDFSKVDSEMNTFETTIRIVGGLLSAHYLSTNFPNLAPLSEDDVGAKGEDLYIEKAVDLSERLLGAFDTPTGIPLSSCILNTSVGIASHADGGAASTAEATTLQLELKYLAKLTGEPLYWEKAEQVMAAVDANRHEGGLVPIFVDPETGKFRGENIRLGSRGDSYYEYLLKQYLQTGSRENIYLEMWDETLEGVKEHLITWSEHANLTVLAERQSGLHQALTPKVDHLLCFLPGTIVLGLTEGKTLQQARQQQGSTWSEKQEENLILAEELMKTCLGMYLVTPTGLAPEITYFNVEDPPRRWNFTDPKWTMPRSLPMDATLPPQDWRKDYDIHSNDVHNLQRPETIESLFYMWRFTGDVQYREWGWKIFESFMSHTAIYDEAGKVVGYSSISNVNVLHDGTSKDRLQVGKSAGRDNMEGFWLAETLKYLYLLFEEEVSPWNDLEKVVFNTEAHPFPRFDIGTDGKTWKTGWQRKERVAIEHG